MSGDKIELFRTLHVTYKNFFAFDCHLKKYKSLVCPVFGISKTYHKLIFSRWELFLLSFSIRMHKYCTEISANIYYFVRNLKIDINTALVVASKLSIGCIPCGKCYVKTREYANF